MIRYIRQNGARYEITESKLEHQRRQIIRRDARRRKKAKLQLAEKANP